VKVLLDENVPAPQPAALAPGVRPLGADPLRRGGLGQAVAQRSTTSIQTMSGNQARQRPMLGIDPTQR